MSVGSSPRVRGTVHRLLRDQIAERFIPACAGNGWRSDRIAGAPTVHPRVCGERSTHTMSMPS